jgi:hypothetical protein
MYIRIAVAVSLAALLGGCRPAVHHGGHGQPGSTSGFPVLTPGPGWNATWVATPPAQGAPGDRGYDEMPSAKFSIIPFQMVTGAATVCLLAGKAPTQAQYAAGVKNAIGRVSFSDDNGPWIDVSQPGQSGVDYCVQINAGDHKDGAHEIRAIVYPLTGMPRVLQGEEFVQPAPTFTGSIVGKTLTVQGAPSAGVLQPGAVLSGVSIYYGTTVTAKTDASHYTVSIDQGSPGVPTETMTGSYARDDDAYGFIFTTNAKGTIPIYTVYAAPPDDVTTPGADGPNCGTSTSPCATMLGARDRLRAIAGGKIPEVGGSHIYLAPNTAGTTSYTWANTTADSGLAARSAWVDIDKWPGREGTVSISGGMGKYGPRIEKVRLGAVTVVADPPEQGGNDGPRPGLGAIQGRSTMLLCDGSTFVGRGLQTPTMAGYPFRTTRWPGGLFVRNCDISRYTNGPLGSEIVLSGHIYLILSDAVTYSRMVINTEVTDLISGEGAHPDVAQYSGDLYQREAYANAAGGLLHIEQMVIGDLPEIIPGQAIFSVQQTNQSVQGGHWIKRQIPKQDADLATFELNDASLTLKSGGVFAGTIVGGSGGTGGTFKGVQLRGPAGAVLPIATVTVSGGKVTAVAITTAGRRNRVGDVLTADPAAIGGVTGFSYTVTQLSNLVMFESPRRNIILYGLHGGYQITQNPRVGANINGQCAYPNQNANFDFLFVNVQLDNSLNPGRTCVSANGYVENFFQLNDDWKGGPNRFRSEEFNFNYSGRNNTIVDTNCYSYRFAYPMDGSVLTFEAPGPSNCAALSRDISVANKHPRPPPPPVPQPTGDATEED